MQVIRIKVFDNKKSEIKNADTTESLFKPTQPKTKGRTPTKTRKLILEDFEDKNLNATMAEPNNPLIGF